MAASAAATNITWQKRTPITIYDNNTISSSSILRFEMKKKNKRTIQLPPINIISCSRPSSSEVSATASEASSTLNTIVHSSASSSQWSDFAKKVSGEWDGYGAEFAPEGKPIELPENVVPEAYREWEVKVFDWQTQCPTLAEPDEFIAKYKLIKLLPTVGCEADAATRHSIDERNIGGADNDVAAFAYQSSGCYVAVWQAKDYEKYSLLELEHCLVDPQNQESRVRIIQAIRVKDRKLVIQNIRVFVEQWYGPFRNGEQLGGCSIRDTAFASTEALKSSEVAGIWQGMNAAAVFHNFPEKIVQQLVEDSLQKSIRDGSNLILLPKNLWCSLKEDNGETHFEVGWLIGKGHAITSKCIFSSNAELKNHSDRGDTCWKVLNQTSCSGCPNCRNLLCKYPLDWLLHSAKNNAKKWL